MERPQEIEVSSTAGARSSDQRDPGLPESVRDAKNSRRRLTNRPVGLECGDGCRHSPEIDPLGTGIDVVQGVLRHGRGRPLSRR